MGDFGARLTSRKFLLAVAACVFVVVQAAGGAMSAADAADAIWKIVAAYIAAEGVADAASRYGDTRALVAEQKLRESIPATIPPPAPARSAGGEYA